MSFTQDIVAILELANAKKQSDKRVIEFVHAFYLVRFNYKNRLFINAKLKNVC